MPEAAAFDQVIHAPHRLRICAALSAAQKVEFGFLQERLALSKSALSKHLSQLVDAGYVSQERGVRDSRSRLWLSLTPAGRRAYDDHVRALQEIVGG
ncbi:transcriptional regulator [Blastococcus sp. CCUG 61487]|uniref:transcriptional regulator n=1 Tax=Blastococcus sp. CCUG 61487 TaxID=1840703 RepID=UPI0010BFF920|nr:transcriptional regulator [Blastococcus sp. CCUG 61487]TKJ34588.1 MarR family transcriptional regulator [Blastococcus sp. CCUG 61487]